MLSQGYSGTTLLTPRTNPELRTSEDELWVWIDKMMVDLQSRFLEAAKQIHVALNSNWPKSLRDRLRVRFDQIAFLMKKIKEGQI